MNKQAQINIGQILVASFLFMVLAIGGFSFYFGALFENSVSPPDGINETEFQSSFNNFSTKFDSTVNQTYSERNKIPIIGGVLDFFSSGVDAVKAAWDSVGFMSSYITFLREKTVLGALLPSTFWGLLVSVMTIILTLIGIGALWRWNLTR